MAWHSPDSHYESFQHSHTAATTAGVPILLNNTVVVPLNDAAANEQNTFIYYAAEITADKSTAADRGVIGIGEKVRVNTTTGDVEDDGGTLAATLVDCGFATEAAVRADTTIKIQFDGRHAGLRA